MTTFFSNAPAIFPHKKESLKVVMNYKFNPKEGRILTEGNDPCFA
jgi:hypothetical protein